VNENFNEYRLDHSLLLYLAHFLVVLNRIQKLLLLVLTDYFTN